MNFIKSLQELTGEQTEFREELWGELVDHIRTKNEKTVTVVLRGESKSLYNIERTQHGKRSTEIVDSR